jgi:Saxitoxin biosynthesis operon protein SxtJ
MAHEDLTRQHEAEGASDRTFGLVFAVMFLLTTAWPLLHGGTARWWALGVAIIFALVALLKPALLAPLNHLWIGLGVLLGKVVSPIALGILFYGIFAPVGTVMRFIGKDPLRLKFDPGVDSYWIKREPPGPPPDSMSTQF